MRRRARSLLLLATPLASALALPALARADGGDETSPVNARAAVQVRKYAFGEELRLALGGMPLDPFQKGWTASLSHTHHFDDLWAWETIQVTGAWLVSSSLRDLLLRDFARRPEEFAAPRLMLTTGVEISPFYGKQVLLNRDTMHGTLLFGVYGGVAFGDRPTFSESLEDVRPVLGAGLGLRVFLSELLSARFDARFYGSYRTARLDEESDELEPLALLTLSLSLGLGGRS